MNNGPLKGIRVTEFTSAWAGPYATCLLAFLGAEVIKVESTKRIDHARYISFSTGKNFTTPDESSVFNSLNMNKQSVTLNLKHPEAVEISKKLIGLSQIVVENMRPGIMPRLGLGYEDARKVKSDIIYLSSSSCGQEGPDANFVGYAPNFASVGGFAQNTGYDDWGPSNFTGSIDIKSATAAAFAILAALCHHRNTGEGQHIDLASQETVAILNTDMLLDFIMNGRDVERKGNRDEVMAPHNCYRCQGDDKWISIAVETDKEWEALCREMNKEELITDERYLDTNSRWLNQEELDLIINDWTQDFDQYDLMNRLQKVGVAAAPSFNSEDLYNDPHVKERGLFKEIEHPVIGKDWVINPPWRLSETPASIERHAPLIGEHNREIICGLLGMSEEELQRLQEEEAVC
ncbi:MAG: CoA transferase [Proteobacteria bacterium]|nr:CoA transferase [Pseudomonadota bacterium]